MDRLENLQLIHELLDGELSEEQRHYVLDLIHSDPVLKREYEDLSRAVNLMESSPRLTLDPLFADDVMKQLPVRRASRLKTIKTFLFGKRVLHWNIAYMTAAVAFSLLVIIGAGTYLQYVYKDMPSASNSAQSEVAAARRVAVNFHAPQAKTVSVAGDFNKWNTGDGIMKRQDNGIWTIEIPLKPGVYHYMFVVDGEGWVPDPVAEAYRDDGFGNMNSVMRINDI